MTEGASRFDWAVFGRPCMGERVSGDAGIVEERSDILFLAIVDVLGHGAEAHALVRTIRDFLRGAWTTDVVALMRQLHETLKGTRGAAVGLGALDANTGELRYTGVGNTTVRKFGARPARLWSAEGIVGAHMRAPVGQTLHVSAADVVVLLTDGVRESFELEEYPQLVCHPPAAVARTLVHRFGKVYDDATCIALRYAR